MKSTSSSRASKTDWKRVNSMKGRDIKITPEHPELDIKHIARVIVRKGLKPVEVKKSIYLRVDAEVLAWFQAQGPGYQTRMNAVLKGVQGFLALTPAFVNEGACLMDGYRCSTTA